MVWLPVPLVIDDVLKFFRRSANNGIWETYWRIFGISGIQNGITFVFIGVALIFLGFMAE